MDDIYEEIVRIRAEGICAALATISSSERKRLPADYLFAGIGNLLRLSVESFFNHFEKCLFFVGRFLFVFRVGPWYLLLSVPRLARSTIYSIRHVGSVKPVMKSPIYSNGSFGPRVRSGLRQLETNLFQFSCRCFSFTLSSSLVSS